MKLMIAGAVALSLPAIANAAGSNPVWTDQRYSYSVSTTPTGPLLFSFDLYYDPASSQFGAGVQNVQTFNQITLPTSVGADYSVTNGCYSYTSQTPCLATGTDRITVGGITGSGDTVSTLGASDFTLFFITDFTGAPLPMFRLPLTGLFTTTNAIGATSTDIVSVSLVNSSVPEPATWGLIGMAIGIVGYALRRRPRITFATA